MAGAASGITAETTSGELDADTVVEDYSVTASDGKTYQVKHY